MDPMDHLGHHHSKISNYRKTLKNQRHHCDDYRGRCKDPPAWERGTPAGTIGNSWTEEAMMSSNWWCLSSLFTPNNIFFLYENDLELLIIVIMLHTQYCVLPPSDGVTSSPKLLHARPAVLGQGLFTTTMWHNVFLLTSTHIQRLINYNNNVFLMTNLKIHHTINHNHNVSLITNTQIQVLINTTQYVLYYKHINTSTYQSQHNVFLFINTQIQVLINHKHMCSSLQTHQYKFSLITDICVLHYKHTNTSSH